MGNEYVLASDVVAVLKTMHEEGYCIGNNDAMLRIFEKLSNLRMVEAEPVVHAHWIEDDACCCRNCSACGFRVGDDTSYDLYGDWKVAPKRCPECGAHMDEEVACG